MGAPVAIVVGLVLIATAILVAGHWQIVNSPVNASVVLRLNRWTGTVELCRIEEGMAYTCGRE